jgi:hypothetical protein
MLIHCCFLLDFSLWSEICMLCNNCGQLMHTSPNSYLYYW